MRLQDIKRTLRAAGPGAVALDLACRAGYKLVRLISMDALVLTPATLNRDFLDFPAGFSYGFLEADDVRRHADAEGLELPGAFVEEALAKGDRCYGILDGDRLVSYFWYARTATEVTDGLVLRFDPSYHYAYKGYTLPEHRGRRLYGYGSAHALTVLTAAGAKGCVTLVDVNNFASFKSMTRTGYVPIGRFHAARPGGRWRVGGGTGCRPYGMAVESASSRA